VLCFDLLFPKFRGNAFILLLQGVWKTFFFVFTKFFCLGVGWLEILVSKEKTLHNFKPILNPLGIIKEEMLK
jgi:hypothetical protein